MSTTSGPNALAARFALANEIAAEAGAQALAFFQDRAGLAVDSKLNGQDAVTIADRTVEQLLRDRIAAAFPDDGILGEEFGFEAGASEYLWVMDPIDGTSPFIFGMPSWCVSIGIVEHGRTAAGVIHAPAAGELFAAMRGHGATLDGAALRLGSEMTVRNGMVGVGASHRIPAERVSGFIHRLLKAEGMFIRNGSGALMLAYVAAGRLAAYYEPHMNAWDCVAGLLIIEEAGGWIHDPMLWTSFGEGGLVLAGAPATEHDMRCLVSGNEVAEHLPGRGECQV